MMLSLSLSFLFDIDDWEFKKKKLILIIEKKVIKLKEIKIFVRENTNFNISIKKITLI